MGKKTISADGEKHTEENICRQKTITRADFTFLCVLLGNIKGCFARRLSGYGDIGLVVTRLVRRENRGNPFNVSIPPA